MQAFHVPFQMKPLVFYQFSYFVQARLTDSVALLYRKGIVGRFKLDVCYEEAFVEEDAIVLG